ncbi:MAG TPA: 30S ribosomal protein S16 [Verrucomicrobiae bacterium]|nr:30S ribosomal protein S16 [Verrucomicrobiae bacterium]
MVVLRLRRVGAKKKPFFRLVAADSRRPTDGRFLETLGTYNPKVKPAVVDLNEERIGYWLAVGAQPSDTVKALFKHTGLTQKLSFKKAGKDVSGVVLKSTIKEAAKAKKIGKKGKKEETPKGEEKKAE